MPHVLLAEQNLDMVMSVGCSTSPEVFVPPCLKCLEWTNDESNVESSMSANPSVEENGSISSENGRLKDLLQTWMFKSLKGHQTHVMSWRNLSFTKNPRKGGIGFERKLNEDGSYWEPHQYPQTVWVPAKRKTLSLALFLGYNSPNPKYPDDDSLDNYKLFKNQHGKAIARYVGLIRLQCIYNFWLFHAIILSILDVYNHFIVILYHFLVLPYWHSAKCQLLIFACFLHCRKSILSGVQTQRNFLWIFYVPEDIEWAKEAPRGAPRGAQPTRVCLEAQARPYSINTPIFQKP